MVIYTMHKGTSCFTEVEVCLKLRLGQLTASQREWHVKGLLQNVRHRQKVRRKERPRRIRIEPICSEAREGSLWSCRRFSIRLPWIERASQPSLPFIFSANCRRPSFFSLLQSLLFVVARSGFLLTICLSIYLSISECFLISVCTHEFSLSFSLFDGLPDALFIV